MEECYSCGQFVGRSEPMSSAQEKKEVLSLIIEEFLKEQKPETYCKEALATIRHTTSLFDIHRDVVLVRRAPFDGALRKVVTDRLRARWLYHWHFPCLEGHPRGS